MNAKSESHFDMNAPLLIADDLALDFVNTQFGVGDRKREYFDSDERVLNWLRYAGLPTVKTEATVRPGVLLQAALDLRESARGLLAKRKKGSSGNLAILNRLLALDSSYSQVVWGKHPMPRLDAHRRVTTIEAALIPVAEAIAGLLVEGDFSMVRKCESSDCTLWFYDRTKSHRRRWCSAALCGNRMKVAAFRARKK
jgi:predicted RNA-binding Zn ribbon-like protein